MDVLLKGRGHRITEHERQAASKKFAHLEDQEPRAVRVEVEIIDQNPRLGGATRIEATFDIPRKTFRAHAEGPDVDSALDEVSPGFGDRCATSRTSAGRGRCAAID